MDDLREAAAVLEVCAPQRPRARIHEEDGRRAAAHDERAVLGQARRALHHLLHAQRQPLRRTTQPSRSKPQQAPLVHWLRFPVLATEGAQPWSF